MNHKVRDGKALTEAAGLGPFPGFQGVRRSQWFGRCTVRVGLGRRRAPSGLLLGSPSLVCWWPTAMRFRCFRHIGCQETLVSYVCCA